MQVHKYYQYLAVTTQLVTRQGGANKTAGYTKQELKNQSQTLVEI